MTPDAAGQLVKSVFHSFYSPLVRHLYRLTGSLDAAEDAAQDAFLALYEELVRGKRIGNPSGWLMTVARHEAARGSKAGRRYDSLESHAVVEAPAQDAGPAPDELSSLMQGLSNREEQALLLRLQSLRYQEIARELGVTRNTVKTLLARALRKLQAAAGGQAGALKRGGEENVPKTLQ